MKASAKLFGLISRASVGTLYILKVGSWENGFVENLAGKFWDELLNRSGDTLAADIHRPPQ